MIMDLLHSICDPRVEFLRLRLNGCGLEGVACFITTPRTPRTSARQHQQHNLVRDSCMVPSDRQDQHFVNHHSLTL